MPKKTRLKCYFGCTIDGTLHTFPRWEYPHTERFMKWKEVLSVETQNRGDNYIFNSVRLCYRHFEEKYRCQHSRNLTRNAVPTLNLVHSNENKDEQLKNVSQPLIPPSGASLMIANDVQNQINLAMPSIQNQNPVKTLETSAIVTESTTSNTISGPFIENMAIPGPSFKITMEESSRTKHIQESESSKVARKRKHESATKKQRPENVKKRSLKPVISSIKHSCHSDVAHKSVIKLKEKIDKLTEKCKNQKQQIIAAKKNIHLKVFYKIC